MFILDVDEFTKIGGAPSGGLFSSYSTIHKKLGEANAARDYSAKYVNKRYQDAFMALLPLVQRFHPVDAGTPGKKLKEVQAVRALQESMRDDLELVRFCRLIDKMAISGKALVNNTGRGMQARMKSMDASAIGFGVTMDARKNAEFTGRTLNINVGNFWQSEKMATSLVVHEYHHVLTARAGDLYADEYVAHWKEYLTRDEPQSKFDKLNDWLLDNPQRIPFAGYAEWKGALYAPGRCGGCMDELSG